MATSASLSDLFKSNPAGGFTIANSTPPTRGVAPLTFPSAPLAPLSPANAAAFNKPAPVAPSPTPLFKAPAAPVAPAAPAQQAPANWYKADGSFKTPEEIAAEVGTALKSAHGSGDVGRLAGDQFGGTEKTAAQLETDARGINNTRNDIATGATDPYKVASQSGIAYTAAELSAIEKAYAGVYDPALDSAMAKLNDKKTSDKAAADEKARQDEIKAQGEETRKTQANAPYTLGTNDVRYDGSGKVIGRGNSSGGAGAVYVPGADPTADAYIKGIQAGTYKASDIPEAYKGIVAQGIAATSSGGAPLSKTSTDAIGIINQLQNLDLNTLSGTGIVGAVEHPSSLFPGTAVQKTQNLAKQLQATISLANRQQLKGSGAISDFEFRVLGDAATALGLNDSGRTNLSPEDFKQTLNNLELKLQVGPTKLTDDEIQYLASPAGGNYTPDEIRAYSQTL